MIDRINNIYFIIITNKRASYILFLSSKILGICINCIRLVSGRSGQMTTAVIIIIFIVDFFPRTSLG
jgi:hypothetical protein